MFARRRGSLVAILNMDTFLLTYIYIWYSLLGGVFLSDSLLGSFGSHGKCPV